MRASLIVDGMINKIMTLDEDDENEIRNQMKMSNEKKI